MTYPGADLYELALQRLPWRWLVRSQWDAMAVETKVKRRKVAADWTRAHRRANPEIARAKARAWRAANLDKERERVRVTVNRIYWNDPAKGRAAQAVYREANRDKTAIRNRKAWPIRDKRVRQAMPAWVKRADILAIYAACPPGHHVDHIIPLCGYYMLGRDKVRVSGLHVPWNLRIVPAVDNLAKRNRLTTP